MTRHIDLGKDIDITFFCILNDLADIIMCIEPTIIAWFMWFGFGEIAEGAGLLYAPGADFSQFGKAFDLDTPALVIGKMPVKNIEFIAGHLIDKSFYFFFCKEVS